MTWWGSDEKGEPCEMVLRCSRCDRAITDEDIALCPFCEDVSPCCNARVVLVPKRPAS